MKHNKIPKPTNCQNMIPNSRKYPRFLVKTLNWRGILTNSTKYKPNKNDNSEEYAVLTTKFKESNLSEERLLVEKISVFQEFINSADEILVRYVFHFKDDKFLTGMFNDLVCYNRREYGDPFGSPNKFKQSKYIKFLFLRTIYVHKYIELTTYIINIIWMKSCTFLLINNIGRRNIHCCEKDQLFPGVY